MGNIKSLISLALPLLFFVTHILNYYLSYDEKDLSACFSFAGFFCLCTNESRRRKNLYAKKRDEIPGDRRSFHS